MFIKTLRRSQLKMLSKIIFRLQRLLKLLFANTINKQLIMKDLNLENHFFMNKIKQLNRQFKIIKFTDIHTQFSEVKQELIQNFKTEEIQQKQIYESEDTQQDEQMITQNHVFQTYDEEYQIIQQPEADINKVKQVLEQRFQKN
ncbi:hypothetical protein pb186bvf_010264 [Paramecium bursaria]